MASPPVGEWQPDSGRAESVSSLSAVLSGGQCHPARSIEVAMNGSEQQTISHRRADTPVGRPWGWCPAWGSKGRATRGPSARNGNRGRRSRWRIMSDKSVGPTACSPMLDLAPEPLDRVYITRQRRPGGRVGMSRAFEHKNRVHGTHPRELARIHNHQECRKRQGTRVGPSPTPKKTRPEPPMDLDRCSDDPLGQGFMLQRHFASSLSWFPGFLIQKALALCDDDSRNKPLREWRVRRWRTRPTFHQPRARLDSTELAEVARLSSPKSLD